MLDHVADLRAYYDEEARQRSRPQLRGPRIDLRSHYIELLRGEGRTTVVDFGCGPGRDGIAFRDAGIAYVGLDLAPENARLGAEQQLTVIPGSITSPPLRSGSFAAAWSMSTLMHLPKSEAAAALVAMTAVLEPGAPFLIGLWGGELGDQIDDTKIPGQRRLFSLRPFEDNRALFEAVGEIEWHKIWPTGPDGWNYQVFRLRVG